MAKGRPRTSFRQMYQGTSLKTKVSAHALLLVLLTVVGSQGSLQNATPVVFISAGILAFIHILLTNPSPVKVGLTLLMSAVLIVALAGIAAEVTTLVNMPWVFLMWIAGLVVAMLIYTVLAYRHSKGKVWITVALAAVTMTATGIPLVVLLASALEGDTMLALFLTILLGGVPVILRSVSRAKNAVLPEDDSLRLSGITGHPDLVFKRKDALNLVGSDNKGRLFVMTAHRIEEPLDVHKKRGLTYKGFPLGGWIADAFFETQKDMPTKMPFTRVISISGDPSLDKEYRIINLVRVDGNNATNIDVFLVGAKNPLKQVAELLSAEKREPTTPENIKKAASPLPTGRKKRRR